MDAARSFRPHCVVSDVLMPVMNGVDSAIRIKKLLPECKVLLVSGEASAPALVKQARDKGYAFPLLPKPFHPTELLRSVADALGTR